MILVVPLFFFLLCLVDVCRRGGGVKVRMRVDSSPVGLDRLDFVSEASMDLDSLRSRYSVKYVYQRGD